MTNTESRIPKWSAWEPEALAPGGKPTARSIRADDHQRPQLKLNTNLQPTPSPQLSDGPMRRWRKRTTVLWFCRPR